MPRLQAVKPLVPPAASPRRTRRGPGLLALALTLPLTFATAQSPTPQAVQDAERAARTEHDAAVAAAHAATAAATGERRLAERRVAAARLVLAAERRVAEAADHARAATAAAALANDAVAARAAALAPAVPVMLRLALWPAESLLAVPAPPEAALRGLLVLQGLSRAMAAEAAALRATGAAASRGAAEAAGRAASLAAAEAAARSTAAALEAELEAARERRAETADAGAEAARRAAAAAGQARDLVGALDQLRRDAARLDAEAARRDAPRSRAAARPPTAEATDPPARGGRAVPVAGRILRAWGAMGEGGPSRGLTFAASPGARVVSPCAGRAVYAAPFRSYGLLLIVDCGDGYHFVLAGLARLDTAPGRRLLAGEPVGVLDGQDGRASLYVELRRHGQPMDPGRWFAAQG